VRTIFLDIGFYSYHYRLCPGRAELQSANDPDLSQLAAHPEDAQKFSSALMKDFDLAKARFLAAAPCSLPITDPT
jgi:hypothetical protein